MTDAPQANPAGLMTIGAVAAHNIAAILNLPVEHVGTIEQAIKDEIGAMSSHFTLAVADVQTQYETETLKLKTEYDAALTAIRADYEASLDGAKAEHAAAVSEIRSTFKYVKANIGKITGVLSAVATVAGFVGHFV